MVPGNYHCCVPETQAPILCLALGGVQTGQSSATTPEASGRSMSEQHT